MSYATPTYKKYAWIIIGLALSAGAVLSYLAPPPRVDARMEALVANDDPGLVALAKFRKTFGDGEMLAVALHRSDLFSQAGLAMLADMTAKIRGVEGVKSVNSMTTMQLPYVINDQVEFKKLVPDDEGSPLQPEQISAIREKALTSAAVVDRFVGRDGETAAIIAELKANLSAGEAREALGKVRAELEALRQAGTDLHYVGMGYVDMEVEKALIAGRWRYLGAGLLLVGIGLTLLFRSPFMAVAAMITAGCPVVMTISLFSLAGGTLNVVVGLLPALALAIALGITCVIIRRHLARQKAGGAEREAAVSHAHLALLIIFGAVAGGASLFASPFAALRDLGLWCLVATLIGAAHIFWVLPALLAVMPRRNLDERGAAAAGSFGLTRQIAMWATARRWSVLGGALVLAALATYGGTRLYLGTNPARFLASAQAVRQDLDYFDRHITGPVSLDFTIRAGQNLDFGTQEALQRLSDYQTQVVRDWPTDFGSALSIVEYYKEMHRAFRTDKPDVGGAASDDDMPKKAAEIADYTELMELSDGKMLSKVVSADKKLARLTISGRMGAKAAPEVMRTYMNAQAGRILGPDLQIEPAGNTALLLHLDDLLYVSLWRSFFIAALVTIMLFAIWTRNTAVSLAGSACFLLVVGLAFGAAGLLGQTLNVAMASLPTMTVVIAAFVGAPQLLWFRRQGAAARARGLSNDVIAQGCDGPGRDVWVMAAGIILALSSLFFGALESLWVAGGFGVFVAMAAAMAQVTIFPAILASFAPTRVATDSRSRKTNIHAA